MLGRGLIRSGFHLYDTLLKSLRQDTPTKLVELIAASIHVDFNERPLFEKVIRFGLVSIFKAWTEIYLLKVTI